MSETDPRTTLNLVMSTFGIDASAIEREPMDTDWAPVERWHLRSDRADVPTSVVIKTRRTEGTGWGYDPQFLRAERRALSTLAGTSFAPHLFAFDDDAGVIVMEDIPNAQTVERILFGSDPDAARQALVRLASTFGQMHTATTSIDPTPWNPTSPLVSNVEAGWETLRQVIADLDLPAPHDVDADIARLATALADPAWWALSHGDAHPSNVLIAGERTVLIDFEGANPRHIAIDGAGFALSFQNYRYWAPLPADVTFAMTDAWRAVIVPGFPAAEDDEAFGQMLATGALAWTIGRLTRLPLIADSTQPLAESQRRRTQIVHTVASAVEVCARVDAYPAIAQWLTSLEAAMRDRWPESNSPRQFPAFNGGSRAGWALFHDI